MDIFSSSPRRLAQTWSSSFESGTRTGQTSTISHDPSDCGHNRDICIGHGYPPVMTKDAPFWEPLKSRQKHWEQYGCESPLDGSHVTTWTPSPIEPHTKTKSSFDFTPRSMRRCSHPGRSVSQRPLK